MILVIWKKIFNKHSKKYPKYGVFLILKCNTQAYAGDTT